MPDVFGRAQMAGVPEQTADQIPPLTVDELEGGWSDEADVVVVGLGAAGLAASIEAAEGGAEVVALDRSGGGGTSNSFLAMIYSLFSK